LRRSRILEIVPSPGDERESGKTTHSALDAAHATEKWRRRLL
jgi:hypothetical protein